MGFMNNEPRELHIIIRDMDIDDMATVFHLGETLFTSGELPILYRTWDAYEVTNYFNTDPDFCLVAEESDEIVGFALGTTFEKEGSPWKYGYLAWIGVKEGQQNRGIGKRLYRELERRMKEEGVRMVIVDSESDNKDALAFFQRTGFSVAEEHIWLSKILRRKGQKGKRTKNIKNQKHKG
jgi:ribosomal protein S18 acetylase RimI-like enzyme